MLIEKALTTNEVHRECHRHPDIRQRHEDPTPLVSQSNPLAVVAGPRELVTWINRSGSGQPGFATALMNKDLGLAMDAVESSRSAAPLGSLVADIYAKFAPHIATETSAPSSKGCVARPNVVELLRYRCIWLNAERSGVDSASLSCWTEPDRA
jgi:hypothetical protein